MSVLHFSWGALQPCTSSRCSVCYLHRYSPLRNCPVAAKLISRRYPRHCRRNVGRSLPVGIYSLWPLHTADFCSLSSASPLLCRTNHQAFALLSPWSCFATLFALLFVYAVPVCWFARPAQSSTIIVVSSHGARTKETPCLLYLTYPTDPSLRI